MMDGLLDLQEGTLYKTQANFLHQYDADSYNNFE